LKLIAVTSFIVSAITTTDSNGQQVTITPQAVADQSSGISSFDKIALGVGIGIGLPGTIATVWLCVLKLRRRLR
jgi:hypothetical protein